VSTLDWLLAIPCALFFCLLVLAVMMLMQVQMAIHKAFTK